MKKLKKIENSSMHYVYIIHTHIYTHVISYYIMNYGNCNKYIKK